MVCKLCGGQTVYDTRRSTEEHDQLVRSEVNKLSDLPCEELVTILTTTHLSFRYLAAMEILVSRGHKV